MAKKRKEHRKEDAVPVPVKPAAPLVKDDSVIDEAAAERARLLVEEAEVGRRNPVGWVGWLIFALAIGWSLFQLSIASVFVLDAYRARAIHLAFAIVLTFLVFPARKGGRGDRVPWYDYILAIIAGLGALYLVFDFAGIQMRQGIPIPREVVLGSVTILLLLEATRRSLGPALAVIAGVFILYALVGPRGAVPWLAPFMPDILAHRGYSLERIVSQMYITTEGVFGIALGVSTQFVFLFVLFGSMLDKAGAGKYFIDVATSFLGVYRGGPAKAAVVASGLTGMISGSSLANVVTTGTFTIPLMKRSGYPPHKAAAAECAVSTNGQLMPPVMGAAAFIIAEFVGIPYFEVVRAAFVPAVVAYVALFYIMHLQPARPAGPAARRAAEPAEDLFVGRSLPRPHRHPRQRPGYRARLAGFRGHAGHRGAGRAHARAGARQGPLYREARGAGLRGRCKEPDRRARGGRPQHGRHRRGRGGGGHHRRHRQPDRPGPAPHRDHRDNLEGSRRPGRPRHRAARRASGWQRLGL
jgi:hypothetical protein